MSNIKLCYVNNKAIKLTKQYLNEYEKIVKLMQQTILQKKVNSLYYENNR